jgi:outer membrane murein-binding lipoprotein Lpp
MDTIPPKEADPLLVAFKQLNTQLEQLGELNRRAEEREQKAIEREQKAIEREQRITKEQEQRAKERASIVLQNHQVIVKNQKELLEVMPSYFIRFYDIRAKTEKFLETYFADLPQKLILKNEHSLDKATKKMVYMVLTGMLISGLLVYFASPHVDTVKLDYQANKIEELNAKLDYMIEKNPKTAKNYEEEKEQ